MSWRPSAVRYRVIIERDEDGVYIAEAPALPGCVSQGHTREEAMANIKEAMVSYVSSLRDHGEPIPPGPEEEFVEIP